ncbi:hypothetical protein [Bacillus phage SDFMU_Pfc]|nr:hypothetical protein [Bacillus phage SDFMU_Pfc]
MALDKVVCCENNHRFRLGIAGDGYRNCPECNELLTEAHANVTKGEPFTLQYISDAFIKKKEPKSSARKLSIEVEGDTTKLQQQLRAIAKHTTALADELDAIDKKQPCERCGSYYGYVQNYFHDQEVVSQQYRCHECLAEYELPTHPEGSD